MEDRISLQRMVSARVPTSVGQFQLILYSNNQDAKEHLALVMGNVTGDRPVLTRVHSECFTGEVLGSRRCDCGEQLQLAMQAIAQEDRGVIVYLRQEGRGIGLLEKLRAYNLQDEGLDTIDANLVLGHEADQRDYRIAAAILHNLGVGSVRLMTNNPNKLNDLQGLGLQVIERVPLVTAVYQENYQYLLTKARRMHHLIDPEEMQIIEARVAKYQNKDWGGDG